MPLVFLAADVLPASLEFDGKVYGHGEFAGLGVGGAGDRDSNLASFSRLQGNLGEFLYDREGWGLLLGQLNGNANLHRYIPAALQPDTEAGRFARGDRRGLKFHEVVHTVDLESFSGLDEIAQHIRIFCAHHSSS